METKRSTLGFFKDSVLSKQFCDPLWAGADDNDENAKADGISEDALLIEHSTLCFGKILDHLRSCALRRKAQGAPPPPPPPPHHNQGGLLSNFQNDCFPTDTSSFISSEA